MKSLFLCGSLCGPEIWESLRPMLIADGVFPAWPHDVTKAAQNVQDLAQWAAKAFRGERFDLLVGHSMGGYVALRLANEFGVSVRRLVLIESNLVPAGPFYRNLMTEQNTARLSESVNAMFARERPFYSPTLLTSLRDSFDETERAARCPVPVYAVCGDRGRPEAKEKWDDLRLSQQTRQRILFVKNACHLPMLENPAALAEIINQITLEAL